jgi:DNA polymerase
MNLLTGDFESFYDKDFSLSKMTTEQYINDPRFEVIGVSIKVNDDPARWFSGTHEEVAAWLSQFDWENSAFLAHNCAFDGAILAWRFGIVPKFYFDTLSMARPKHKVMVGGSLSKLVRHYKLGEKGTEVIDAKGKRRADFTPQQLAAYGRYCTNDTELTHALFGKLKAGFPVSELLVIDQTLRMYTQPVVCLDTLRLRQHLHQVRDRKQEHLDSISKIIPGADPAKVLRSNQQFGALLERLGVEIPVKVSPTTNNLTYAFAKTDKGMTDLLEHPDERVQTVTAARLGVKSSIEETRTEALLGVAERGKLPIMLNYYGAHTGRFSGGDGLNLQNLPKRGNTAIRDALMAPPGHSFIVCDLSQIEARMLAWLAGQEDLVQAFRDKRDVYSEFASDVYGRKITKADKVERFVGKTCILGLGYGMGAEKFRRTLEIGQAGISVKIDLNEAYEIVNLYRNKNFKIPQLWNEANYALNSMAMGVTGKINDILPYSPEGIELPSGFHISYPLLRNTPEGHFYVSDQRSYQKAVKARIMGEDIRDLPGWTKIYGGKVVENFTQALAALLIREQMVAVGRHYRVAFQVHDEIIAIAPHADAQQAEQDIVRIMSQPPVWAPDLPVACESKIVQSYGAA